MTRIFGTLGTTTSNLLTDDDISVTTNATSALSARAFRTSPRADRRRVDHPTIPSIAARSWTLTPPRPRPSPTVVLIGRTDAGGARLARRVLPRARSPHRANATPRHLHARARGRLRNRRRPPLPHGRLHVAPSLRSLLREGPLGDDARSRRRRRRQVRRRRGIRTAAGCPSDRR